MVIIKPQSLPYQQIKYKDIPELISGFMSIVDVQALRLIIESHIKSLDGGPTLVPLSVSKRFIKGLMAAILVGDSVLRIEVMEKFDDALFLMKYYTELYALSNQVERDRLWGMLRDAVSKKGDARRFFFEIATAFIYADYGCCVSLTDVSGSARYEFLVEKSGCTFEVEVKTISSLTRHGLSGAAFDAFASAVRQGTKNLSFPHSNNQLQILVSGTHEKAAKAISDFNVCLRGLRQGEQQVRHGCIRIGIKSVPESDVDSVEAFVSGQELRMPWHLEQYQVMGMLETLSGRAFNTISFRKPWRVSKAFDEALDDAFSKFTGKNQAVVWLYLIDATPFSINPFRKEVGILKNTEVKRVLDRYSAAGRYSYPTGIVISSNLFSAKSLSDSSLLKMTNYFLFRPSRGLATDHGIIAPLRVG